MSGDNLLRRALHAEPERCVAQLAGNIWGGMIDEAANERRQMTALARGLQELTAPQLVNALRSGDVETQRVAYRRLHELGGEATPYLLRGLGAEDQGTRFACLALLRHRVQNLSSSLCLGQTSLGDVEQVQRRVLQPRERTLEELREHIDLATTQVTAIDAWIRDPANAAAIRELQAISGVDAVGETASSEARRLLDLPQRARLNLALLCAQELSEHELPAERRRQLQSQTSLLLRQLLNSDQNLVHNPEFLSAMRFAGFGFQPVSEAIAQLDQQNPAFEDIRHLQIMFARLGGNHDAVWQASRPWRVRRD